MSDPQRPPPPLDPPQAERTDATPGDEEVAHYDDAVIGTAFRWSLVVLAIVVAGGAGAFFWLQRKPPARAPQLTQLSAPQPPPSLIHEIPVTRFTDITASAGIAFTHVNGAYGDKLLPETMGGGVAFFDFDNDGDPDLLLINSTFWPGHAPADKPLPTMALYRNDGTGQFTDVTAESGLDVTLYGQGCAVGDYDNDSWVDVFITGVGGNRLFRNLGTGRFEDVTLSAGVGGSGQEWSTSCAFFDYDRDGRLDLFVCNYVQWSKEIDYEVGYKLVGIGRAYGQPRDFPGTFPFLYHNDGNGRFTDVSKWAGVQIKSPVTGVPAAKSLGLAPADLDNDGWLDVVVANDTVQNYVFHNNRDGTFREIGALAGIAFDSYGQTRGAMGIDVARFRNDDAIGIAIGNFANEMTALYVSQTKPLTFADEAITEGIGPASRLLLKFGIFFFDYDLDGRLDVLTANGHLETEISKVQQSQTYAQPAQLFWNAGGSKGPSFISVPPAKCGPDLFQPIVGRGSAFADLDGDGDLDVILAQIGGPPLLLRNDQKLGHHWLRLKLVGATANRDAIGAEVRIRLASRLYSRTVMPTRGYLSQSELPVTFGLGNHTRVDGLEIRWPGGKTQVLDPRHLKIDALHVITQER
ncbi:MAG: CRTAC1 family protein [Verrucomicrobia bacterium]|nr:CRTAC1 family protein [Verrucomicrobiota bacterium]